MLRAVQRLSQPSRAIALSIWAALSLVACQKSEPTPTTKGSAAGSGSSVAAPSPAGSGSATAPRPAPPAPPKAPPKPAKDIDSKEILERKDTVAEVSVKHVLLAWDDLASVYGPRMNPEAAKRTNEDAAKLALATYEKVKADWSKIDELAKTLSEDPGSKNGTPYTVAADTQFVPEFKTLALRLKLKEAGIVKTQFGYHVIVRVPPAPPDPLESKEIFAREPSPSEVEVQHILIGWKEAPGAQDPRAKARSKADADALATKLLKQVRAGEDIAKLMKEHSEDPGSKDDARAYEISPDAPFVAPFKKLSLRLKVGEAGLAKTEFGWHIIKRVAPDSLNSGDILARKQVAADVKVKHILLGWKGANSGSDPRGQKRERAELEKLVKDTVAKLKGGAKIEPLMKELSEDPGSAASGDSYPVSPTASLVPPFKALSLRLNKNEVGVVKSQFGIHIIQRVE
jgi:parvulin-like peptidyl-prolyl isomerase